jgi:endonuclease/exonuclease/phosphatase family metal-dependent hydrolase
MRLTFGSYNIHKAIGADGRRDADRIVRVLHEMDADVVALQEADLRFGTRAAVLPRSLLEESHWQVVALAMRAGGMGWHGNSILVRRGIDILDAAPITLPSLEPRGAVHARLAKQGRAFDVVGMHLDLSGLLRRRQIATVCGVLGHAEGPAVIMGDCNEWSARGGALTAFAAGWQVLNPGHSFPARRPLASLDRIAHTAHWQSHGTKVCHSALAVAASDHLPVRAELELDA